MDYFEIEAQGRELASLLEDLQEELRHIDRISTSNRSEKFYHCSEIVQQIRTVRTAYLLELKALEDEALIKKYKSSFNEKDALFGRLVAELESKKHEIDRSQLLSELDEIEEANPEVLTAQQLKKEGDKVQDKTQEAIDRIRHITADTEHVGLNTVMQMNAQLEKLEHITQEYEHLDTSIRRARITAKDYARSAATDRCVQLLVVAIILCVIVLIVLFALK